MTTISTAPAGGRARRGTRSRAWTFVIILAVAAGGLFLAYRNGWDPGRVRDALARAATSGGHAEPSAGERPAPGRPAEKWDGLVSVPRADQQSIGFGFAPAEPQTTAIRLELNGRTAYNPDTITKIRPRFDTRVERVFALLGQRVKKGDPLVELYSNDLAAAKSDFQTKYVQWQHDSRLLKTREPLARSGAISQQLWVDTQNDELKSRLDFNIARDKLTVIYEVPKEEIDPLLERLGESTVDFRSFGEVPDKARLIIRAKTDGYVIAREVVPGNFYETTDVLMEVAPLDHLWVWVNVFEVDQDKVGVGQTMEIQFPFLSQRIKGTVNYVAPEVSKDTRAVKIRATIPNPESRLKADMLVKAMLEIPPVAGHTVIPRPALVTIGGEEYVFVRVPGDTSHSDRSASDRFERRKVKVAVEHADHVVVARGLNAKDEVVTHGSLILAQLYEDQKAASIGLNDD